MDDLTLSGNTPASDTDTTQASAPADLADVPAFNLDTMMSEPTATTDGASAMPSITVNATASSPSVDPASPNDEDTAPVEATDTTAPPSVHPADPFTITQDPATPENKDDLGAFPKQVADQVEALLEKSVEEEQNSVADEERSLSERKTELVQKRRELEDAKKNIDLQESNIKSQEEELTRHTLELQARKERIHKAIKALEA